MSISEKSNFVTAADGTALFVRDWGEGEPIVFISSWSMPSESTSYVMLRLVQQGFRCIAFDRRGHGKSGDAGGGYDFDTLAGDIASVIAARGLEGITLVGHSVGCAEIVRYLTRHGAGRVARIALVSGVTPMLAKADDNPDGVDPAIFDLVRREMLGRDFPKWLEDNMEPFFTPETSPRMREWVRGMALQTSLQALVEINRSMTEADFRAELKAIHLPALVIHGDKDVSAPLGLTATPTVALLPNVELHIYKDAPHGTFVTHIDRLAEDLALFAKPETIFERLRA